MHVRFVYNIYSVKAINIIDYKNINEIHRLTQSVNVDT